MKPLSIASFTIALLALGIVIYSTFKQESVKPLKPCGNITYTQSQLQALNPGDTIFVTGEFKISYMAVESMYGTTKYVSTEVAKIVIIENNIKNEVLGYRFISTNDTIYKKYCSLY